MCVTHCQGSLMNFVRSSSAFIALWYWGGKGQVKRGLASLGVTRSVHSGTLGTPGLWSGRPGSGGPWHQASLCLSGAVWL